MPPLLHTLMPGLLMLGLIRVLYVELTEFSDRRFRRDAIHRLVTGLCPVCGYDLCTTPTTCPECGTHIPTFRLFPSPAPRAPRPICN